LGKRTFGLSHPAFNFLAGPEDQEGQFDTSSSVLILERITVDKTGDTYAGSGILKVVGGIDPLDPTAPVLFTENLNITGKRVTVDVNQLPPLNWPWK